MEPTTQSYRTKTERERRLPLDRYVLLTESAPELYGTLDEWHTFYQPATPGERMLLDMAVMASVQRGRVLACQTATVNQQIGTAVFQFDCDQEDDVDRFRALLPTRPGAAVLGLKRSALGVRFLIGRWDRLLRLIQKDGTLYGNDRTELIHYQGARATVREDLHESEGAYLTWLYCIMCQPEPQDQDLVEIGNHDYMPESLQVRDINHWSGPIEISRQLMIETMEHELRELREREAILRAAFETPDRDSAEVRKQVLTGPVGAQFVRQSELHERQFHRSYNAFLKGRERTAKTGLLPGIADPKRQGVVDDPAGEDRDREPQPNLVEESRARRTQTAAALAPGAGRVIGKTIFRADHYRNAAQRYDESQTPADREAPREASEQEQSAPAKPSPPPSFWSPHWD